MARYFYESLKKYHQIAVISDIHGNFNLLQRLLKRHEVESSDLIIFNGDYINRGRESLKCIRWLMEHQYDKNIRIIRGNMDRVASWYTYGKPIDIINHLSDHVFTLWDNCMTELKQTETTLNNFENLRSLYCKNYSDEISFLEKLPNVMETESMIFLHGGLGHSLDWSLCSEQEIMKNDSFIFDGINNTGKWVICGHIPTWNSPKSLNSDNCIIDFERRCVFTDGGNKVKRYSQLNALIINNPDSNPSFSTIFESDFPVFICQNNNEVKDRPYYKSSWPGDIIVSYELIEKDPGFVRAVSDRGESFIINRSHILKKKGKLQSLTCTINTSIPTVVGETLELLDIADGNQIFVKNSKGKIGWVNSSCLFKS